MYYIQDNWGYKYKLQSGERTIHRFMTRKKWNSASDRYYGDWNMIMAVLSKIAEEWYYIGIEYLPLSVDGCSYICKIGPGDRRISYKAKWVSADSNNKMDAVWIACVEHIRSKKRYLRRLRELKKFFSIPD